MKFKSILTKAVVGAVLITIAMVTPVQAFTSYELDSDLNYKYDGAREPEFYNHTGAEYNYNGVMPLYMQQIYGTGGQTIYNSNFGSNIVELNGYGVNTGNTYGYGYGMDYGNYISSVESSYFDSVAGGGQYYNVNVGNTNSNSTSNADNNSSSTNSNLNISYSDNVGSNSNSSVNGILPNEVGDVTFPSYFADANNSYNNNISTNKDVSLSQYSDGRIGTIKIANAGLVVKGYDYSDIYQSMKKGAGHLDSTAYWNGNVVYFGHNRGSNGYFSKLKNVEVGDIVVYETKEGKRQYKVDTVKYIDETDWSAMSYSSTNKITLITCVADKPNLRLLVQGREIN